MFYTSRVPIVDGGVSVVCNVGCNVEWMYYMSEGDVGWCSVGVCTPNMKDVPNMQENQD